MIGMCMKHSLKKSHDIHCDYRRNCIIYTHSYCIGIICFCSIKETELNLLIILTVLKHEIMTTIEGERNTTIMLCVYINQCTIWKEGNKLI